MMPTAQTLARTYSDRVYPDPWEKVLDHRRVLEYVAEHPNAGRVRVGNALDLPPGRVRSWLDGAIPDPVRGINTAIDHGWIEPDLNGEMAAALVELSAHILAGGSIAKGRFVPAATPGRHVSIDELRDAFDRVGVKTTTRHDDADGRATEVVPTEAASVLGRCLSVMGVPVGDKTNLNQLPAVVWDVPRDVQRAFARIYIRHRASKQPGKATLMVQEKRPRPYLEDLQTLFLEVTDKRVTVSDHAVTISADAVREFGLA